MIIPKWVRPPITKATVKKTITPHTTFTFLSFVIFKLETSHSFAFGSVLYLVCYVTKKSFTTLISSCVRLSLKNQAFIKRQHFVRIFKLLCYMVPKRSILRHEGSLRLLNHKLESTKWYRVFKVSIVKFSRQDFQTWFTYKHESWSCHQQIIRW